MTTAAPTEPPAAPDTAPVSPPPATASPAPGAGAVAPGAVPGATRGRRQSALLRLGGGLSPRTTLALSTAGLVLLLGGWTVASGVMESFLFPTPAETWRAASELYRSGELVADLRASTTRIAIGYSLSMAVGVVLGVLIGSFRSVESFLEAQIGFLRYIPASALGPLFLVWLGIDETPKIAFVFVGTVFFNVLMIADVARAVPKELVNASYTLGAGRATVLRRVVLPHSWPGIIDAARVNLAAGWLMLVVAELLAAQEGLAYRIVRAQRTRDVPTMFAVLIVFGLIGLASDLTLRWLRKRTAPWSEGSR